MPRYDYQCLSCDHEFELVQSFSEAGTGICPLCASESRRVYHAVPVIYKGSGFYTTDYGRPKPPVEDKAKETKDTKESKNGQAPVDKASSSTSDSKTETPSKAASEAKS